MRAELPWNVAGIPPEAREAARAAARREGLSVGEWLTRRILHSFSGAEDDSIDLSYEHPAPSGAPLDSWGLPPSAASRRDSEEMLARVGRSETESNEAWRRIEEQLKGLGRRLDFSERSHSESNRALSRTAQEMNASAREQAHAFEQLGKNIMGLHERLERLERSTPSVGLREAVKALHLGLSRLADQITSTANHSASQLVQVTDNLEKLAGHVGQIWEDADSADQLLNRRIDITVQELDQRFRDNEGAWDARLSQAEKAAQFNTNALDHALEQIEAAAAQRAADQAEIQRNAAQQVENVHRLEDSITRLETRLPGAKLEDRLEGIEHSVSSLTERLEQPDPTEKFDASLQALSHRLEELEKEHAVLAAELLAKPLQPQAAHEQEPTALEQEPAAHQQEPAAHEAAIEAASPLHAPPFIEPSAYEPLADEPPADETAVHELLADEPLDDEPPAHEPPFGVSPPHNEPGDDFALPQQDFAVDVPQHQREDSFTSEFAGMFEEPAEPENFLAQARRSARAASEKAENEGRGRMSAFRWSQNAAESEEKARPRYLIPIVVALVVVLAAAAAFILSQRARVPEPMPAPRAAVPVTKIPTIPAPAGNNQLPTTPQTENRAAGPSDAGSAEGFNAQRSQPDAAAPPAPVKQADVSTPTIKAVTVKPVPGNPMSVKPTPVEPTSVQPAPIKPATVAPTTVKPMPANGTTRSTPSAAMDRVIKMVNAGNPTALAILGLRALDGTNGARVNLQDAVKFLSQAAEKGQAVAQYRLGTLYERGQGVPVDSAKAMHWYEMAANQGNRKAMHNLAVAYAGGVAGKKNMTEAARWFARAATLGLSDSQFNLAVLYERGDGVPQSLADAYKWYSVAAAGGDAESKARIGVLQTQLGDADKATAGKSAAAFHATPLNRSTNVPPEPADLN
jgi:localization factor PodJL